MTKEEFITAIANCTTVREVLEIEGLFYDYSEDFSFIDTALVELHIGKRKCEILNV